MANNKKQYNDQSIVSLNAEERVRKKPAVIFGSDDLVGCEHAFFEILSNSIDEAREGYGRVINITAFNDHSLEVEDFGRGVPMDWNEREKKYNWELVYYELYASGKYDNNEGGVYGFSLGTNGLGACATQYTSEYMTVTSYTNGNKYTMNFQKGKPKGKLQIEPAPRGKTGTVIRWKPDLEVFNAIDIQKEYFCQTLQKQAVANDGLTLVLKWQEQDGKFEQTEYCYENGIDDYVEELVGDRALTPIASYSAERDGSDRDDKSNYKLKMRVSFCFANDIRLPDGVERVSYFHNSSPLEHGGSPEKAVKAAFVWAIDNFARNGGKYTKAEKPITYSDVQESLLLVLSSFSTVASYENQTKKSITNTFIAEAMTDWLKGTLETYFAENPACAEKISLAVLANKRARESAALVRSTSKKRLTAALDMYNQVEKFVNCREKDPSICEIYIVEGDSALTSCKLARNGSFQALLPVRGKTLNCVKAPFKRIMESEIITDLIKVLGCGYEYDAKGKVKTFDISSLRWNKIIICTDADDDGYQIRTLLLTMFFRLLPSLIQSGKIYIAETPLYELRTSDETFFAYDEKEKEEVLSKLAGKKVTVMRSKGLGENEPEMMERTTMHPATRRLIRVSPEDEDRTAEMFDLMLGDNLTGRKAYIVKHGRKYLRDVDV